MKALKGPVLGHFATQDQSIDAAMVGGFEQAMKGGRPRRSPDHLLVRRRSRRQSDRRPLRRRDAALAWDRTLRFLRRRWPGDDLTGAGDP